MQFLKCESEITEKKNNVSFINSTIKTSNFVDNFPFFFTIEEKLENKSSTFHLHKFWKDKDMECFVENLKKDNFNLSGNFNLSFPPLKVDKE